MGKDFPPVEVTGMLTHLLMVPGALPWLVSLVLMAG